MDRKESVITLAWLVVGQILMVVLQLFHQEVATDTPLVIAARELLPVIDSIKSTNVFNEEIALMHFSVAALCIPAIVASYFLVPSSSWLSNSSKKNSQIILILIVVSVSIVLAVKPVDGGRIARGLVSSSYGFALVSMITATSIAASIRSVTTVVSIIKKL